MNSKLIAYAMDFSSFLVHKIKDKNKIKNIILFGSTSRDEATQESDIDLFIDIVKENKVIEKEIRKCLSRFNSSSKYTNYWKPLGIDNELKLTIGDLEKWTELKPSIIANGITLYGKFLSEIKTGRHSSMFFWENVQPNSKRVLFNKKLFGFKQNKKFYQGLIQEYNGERLGKGCIIVPLEHSNIFHNLFKKHKITVKIKKALVY